MYLRSVYLLVGMLGICSIMLFPSHEAAAQSFDDEEYGEEDIYDPLETWNRGVYEFNDILDSYILKPTARGYRKVVPSWGRERVHSFLRNLTEPVTFVNAVLQLDKDRAFTSFWRFTINSTWGVGGMFDIAGQEGLVYRDEDFGQTLGKYGIGPGPYIVLPLLGPSDARDVVGKVADVFADPFTYILEDDEPLLWTRYGVNVIDTREQLLDITDDIDASSFDRYATYRSIFLQNRKSKISNGVPTTDIE